MFAPILLASSSLLFALAPPPSASVPAPPTLQEALAPLQSGDFVGAARLLEAFVVREPENGRAWRSLGLASANAKDPERAIAAYQKALALDPGVPTPLLALARIYAGKHDAEGALSWLAKARASGKLDLTEAQVAPEFAFLLEEPRFAALMPRPADFARPFVEPVTILREWDGEAAEDQFGWIARNLGDVDGDGVPDFVTSAPTHGGGAGRVYVYSTRTGALLWTFDGEAGDQAGSGLEAAGDANGDGIPDVVVGAPANGRVYVLSGKDGHRLLTLNAEGPGDQLGQHVAGVGDVDRDGFADLLVGAPGNGAGGKGAGRAYLYSGRDGHVLLRLTGERAGDAFGATVAGRTQNGKSLWMVGAPSGGPRQSGRVYVYEGLSTVPKWKIDSDETGAALGAMFLSLPGDLDGDGAPDTYESDFSNRAKGPSTGRVYVHSGKDGHPLLTLTGETAGEGFGTSPSVAGDVDGDGRPDLIVGAWQYAGAAVSGGRATLYSGREGRQLATFTCRTPGDTFGFDAVGMGDVDGDGTVDLLITSGWSAVQGHHSGRVFLVSSGIRRAPVEPASSAVAPAPSPDGDREREVRGVVERYRSAWLANEPGLVLGTFAPDAVLVAPGHREPIAGREAIAAYWWPAGGPPTRITGFDLVVEDAAISGDLAVVRGHDRVDFVTGAPPGSAGASQSHFLTVLRRDNDGSWRIRLHTWQADPT